MGRMAVAWLVLAGLVTVALPGVSADRPGICNLVYPWTAHDLILPFDLPHSDDDPIVGVFVPFSPINSHEPAGDWWGLLIVTGLCSLLKDIQECMSAQGPIPVAPIECLQ